MFPVKCVRAVPASAVCFLRCPLLRRRYERDRDLLESQFLEFNFSWLSDAVLKLGGLRLEPTQINWRAAAGAAALLVTRRQIRFLWLPGLRRKRRWPKWAAAGGLEQISERNQGRADKRL